MLLTATLGAVALVLFAGWGDGVAPWQVTRTQFFAASVVAVSLAATIITRHLLFPKMTWQRALVFAIVGGAVFLAPAYLTLLMANETGLLGNRIPPLNLHKATAASLSMIFFGLAVFFSLPWRAWLLPLVALLVVGIAAKPAVSPSARSDLQALWRGEAKLFVDPVDYLFSSLHDIKSTNYPLFDRPSKARGGGLSVLDERRVLLVTGHGSVHRITLTDDGPVMSDDVGSTPFDRDAYFKAAEAPSNWYRLTDAMAVDRSRLDAAVVERLVRTGATSGPNADHALFTTYHEYDPVETCISLVAAVALIEVEALDAAPEKWHVLHRTSPCSSTALHNGTGGRMQLLDNRTLLYSVGESFSRWDNAELIASEYGKMLAVDLTNSSTRIFSRGHRNPQGLVLRKDGTIWATEHGPHGGDELNVIRAGADFGWPYSTYGTSYGKKTWIHSKEPGRHLTGVKPVYAWVPSIGISNVIEVEGKRFSSWRGDLLVASLFGQDYGKSLFRVRTDDERVIVVEKIRTGKPIRDLVEMPDGRIVLWDGTKSIQVLEPANHLFSACSGCHAMRWRNHSIGPDLMGVVGRRVALHKKFQYSRAMERYGGRWTRERLGRFLANPMAEVPGTEMNYPGLSDPGQRQQIIDYLAKMELGAE